MTVAILIPENWEPSRLIVWSTAIARARNEDQFVVRPKRQSSGRKRKSQLSNPQVQLPAEARPLATAIGQHAGDFGFIDLDAIGEEVRSAAAIQKADPKRRRAFVQRIARDELFETVLKRISELRVTLLIVPRHRGVRFNSEEFAVERQLLLEVHCETLQFRPGSASNDDYRSILVASSGSRHALPALNIGAKLATRHATDVTALYVHDDAAQVDQARSKSDGKKVVERIVRKSLKKKSASVRPDSVADDNVPRGLRSYAAAKGHGMIILGGGRPTSSEGPSRVSVSEKLLAETNDQTVVVVRKAKPLTARLLKTVERFKKVMIPQLDRKGRIDLVQRLKSNCNWNFDFCFLICLATMLAALGLSRDSAPVVIGAMLVAPLMTPMLGLGMSVVQGNRTMGMNCLMTIGRGFTAAFLTGLAVGMIRICLTSGMNSEISSRCGPALLDLVVAFVSAMVAAYAFGRPHLLAVLPGIAIATSLVPPVATVGLCLCMLEFEAALGALLLFLSNFVSIVIGSATALWFVGMRGPREHCHFATWARRCAGGMFAAALGLTIYFTTTQGISDEPALAELDQAQEATEESPDSSILPDPPPTSPVVAQHAIPDQTLHEEMRRRLDEVQVVLKPRPTGGRRRPTVDVILIVPNSPEPVQLDGIVAKQNRPGWVTLDFPPLEHWASHMQQLDSLQQAGLRSQDFYMSLTEHVSRQFAPELAL